MRVLVWITEGTWAGCVDAALRYAPADSEFTLLHVTAEEIEQAAHGAFAGLLGRGHVRGRDPAMAVASSAEATAADLLSAAAERLGRSAQPLSRRGRVERVVVAAADEADLLVCARDGEHDRLGPHSLGPHTRFVVDHAPCAVLLVWPDEAPALDSIPPPPPPGHEPPHKHAPPRK
jgi:nucleotide-binding universal stress UspA family protein